MGNFYQFSGGYYLNADGSNDLIDAAKDKFKLVDNLETLNSNIAEMQRLVKEYARLSIGFLPQKKKKYRDAVAYLKVLISDHENYKTELIKRVEKSSNSNASTPKEVGGVVPFPSVRPNPYTYGNPAMPIPSPTQPAIDESKPDNKKLLLYGGIGLAAVIVLVLLVRKNG